MRIYETIAIIRPNVAEDGIGGIIDRAKGIIEGDGGSILKVDKWGLRKLAYPIKKEQQGSYLLAEFNGTAAAVAEMERIFKIDDRILKFMTIKLKAPSSAAPARKETTGAETGEAAAE
ncbi:MAG: 30S ribosomal protein S6 [Desulfobacteraceae bacterium]|nr:30S ribosomal protein S6 [Desulfobacteraceae bacterium]